ncbi:MAG TPA: lysine biosynthesis protein LysW [Thermoflexales bacterium]|nr:lysine biosynthesis protein LysW [Thermoflexales bacterium]HQW35320.1 lysine biosynthesis protein LysW [Thermoflexales bacterium]HQX75362.1 lysine biosynthesis protein LysW [Thermoflexales bacterium]HQZ23579.1 lysine biosynthesis protein LysW [Thermoflexales bacterium]
MTAECPECAGDVKFKEAPMLHELVRCGECGAELEVVALDPIKLDLAPTEEEDWGE